MMVSCGDASWVIAGGGDEGVKRPVVKKIRACGDCGGV